MNLSSPVSWLRRLAALTCSLNPLVGRSAVIVCCAVVAITACSHRATSAPTNPTAPASGVDALIVSVDEVRRIANYEELKSLAHADLRHPPPGDLNAPGSCRAAGTSDLTFANGWSEFRSAGYSGVTDELKPGGPAMIDSVSQAVAIYPDAGAARNALDQLESSLTGCAALHDPNYKFTVDRPDSSTLRITDRGWSHLYRVKSKVLMSVGVVGLEPAEPIATSVLGIITDRIK